MVNLQPRNASDCDIVKEVNEFCYLGSPDRHSCLNSESKAGLVENLWEQLLSCVRF